MSVGTVGMLKPAVSVFDITAGATTFAPTRAISVAEEGDLNLTMEDGTSATVFLVAGSLHPIRATNVASSGTTATGIKGWR